MTTGIIGAGISGLSFAYKAAQFTSPSRIKIFEASNQTGGWLRTILTPSGAKFETGPRSIRFAKQPASRFLLSLVDQLNLGPCVIARDKHHESSQNRYIYINEKIEKLPSPSYSLIGELQSVSKKTNFMTSSILSNVCQKPITSTQFSDDVSVYQMIEERFGWEMAAYMADAVCRGIFASSARDVCWQYMLPAHVAQQEIDKKFDLRNGSKISNLRNYTKYKKSQSYREVTHPDLLPYYPKLVKRAEKEGWKAWNLENGLSSLTGALSSNLKQTGVEISLNTPIRLIERQGSTFSFNNKWTESYSRVVSSISPKLLSMQLAPNDFSLELIELLNQYQETELLVYLVELDEHILPKEVGFGFLVPSCEDENLLGITYDSCTFPEYDSVRGGSRYTIMAYNEIDPQEVLKKTLGIDANVMWSTCINASIPRYNKNHLLINDQAKECARSHGIELIGNYVNRVSIPDCIYSSMKTASNLFQVQNSEEKLIAMKY